MGYEENKGKIHAAGEPAIIDVLGLQETDKGMGFIVGGKGANLGELFKIDGLHIPNGFCITTAVFRKIISQTPAINEMLDQLSLLKIEERDAISEVTLKIRIAVEDISIPIELGSEIQHCITQLGETAAYAIRSSATAEDLPTASFAGQQDTYLNIIGMEAILKHIKKCWASLYSERAVLYRLQNGFDHHRVHLAVIVQKMIFPEAAGILFTADPVTSNRKVVSIDAGFGLGEALVAGLVNADNYKVHSGNIIAKKIPAKKLAVQAMANGGTQQQAVAAEQQNRQVLTDEQIIRLERIGRTIERHFGCPQDIEWCLADNTFYIVQSRPITTLFPIPESTDDENHVYLSVGHQQMMTDPIKPLGMAVYLLVSFGQRYIAAGRLFVDVAAMLASPDSRNMLLTTMEQHDPLMKDALLTILQREDFIKTKPGETAEPIPNTGDTAGSSWKFKAPIENDPAIVTDLIRKTQTSIDLLKQVIQTKTGTDLIDFIRQDIEELKRILFDPESRPVYMSAMDAYTWINEKMNAWLGESSAADILSQSVPNNVTSEMGLALLDVADVIRPYPAVIALLEQVKDDNFLDELDSLEGGQVVKAAIEGYLAQYGMRCAGEIDITRTRWSEKPSILVPLILSNIKNFEPGAGKRKFQQGQAEAIKKEQELLERLSQMPEGEERARETQQVISLMRNYIGYREYPKYGMVSRYLIYKQALMKEAQRLVEAGVISEKEDIYYLTLDELYDVIRTHELDYQSISKRKEEYRLYERLMPSRVITSDGEIVAGAYKRENIPQDALVGLSVSAGVVEGRARVILNMEDAILGDEDILVTSFTDPSWTPLFLAIKGLVTEVGGLMTHGAVIAREYGLPAVVGVENATRLIKDGQRIRLHGTAGYIEILN